MGVTLRRWKPVLAALALGIGAWFLRSGPVGAAPANVGVVLVAAVGLAYVAEELFWISRRTGRPCSRCGQPVRLKPFRITFRCPHCGGDLE